MFRGCLAGTVNILVAYFIRRSFIYLQFDFIFKNTHKFDTMATNTGFKLF